MVFPMSFYHIPLILHFPYGFPMAFSYVFMAFQWFIHQLHSFPRHRCRMSRWRRSAPTEAPTGEAPGEALTTHVVKEGEAAAGAGGFGRRTIDEM